MKLDRNTNTDGRGKYALLKLRRQEKPISSEAVTAATILKDAGLLHFGNEGPGEQFFVMKYKDRFTAPALRAYAAAVMQHAQNPVLTPDEKQRRELIEYANEINHEAEEAERLGEKLPT